MSRIAALLLTLAALMTALAAPAGAPTATVGRPAVVRAARALESDPVYVDPAAQKKISAADAQRLRDEIASKGDGPIYIAILPENAANQAGGDPYEVVLDI